jgi:uncharacterized membrane protein YagU involved in acid resistance
VERSVTLRDEIAAGLLAGSAGGIAFDVFLFALQLASGAAPAWMNAHYAFIASVLLGPSAYANPVAVPLGVVLHFCVAVGWALGYVYLARAQRQLLTEPWLSGAAFGVVVYVFMQIVVLTAGQYHRPNSPSDFSTQLLGHVIFYGIPVALVAAARLPRAATPSTGSGSGQA